MELVVRYVLQYAWSAPRFLLPVMHMASVLGHLHLVSAVTSHVLCIFSILGFPPQPRHHLCSFMHSSPKRSIQRI